jgi:leucyl aminopeptidase
MIVRHLKLALATSVLALSHTVNLYAQSPDAVVTIGNDALLSMTEQQRNALAIKTITSQSKKQSDAAIIRLPEQQLEALSQYMHKNHHRCGGYIWHESESSAQKYLQKVGQQNNDSAASNRNLVEYTIDNTDSVYALLSRVVKSNLTATVETLGAYNNRYYTQQSGVDSAQWIQSFWSNLASTRNDISVSLYQHNSWAQPSVVATITGQSLPDEVVVVGGHLDSINGSSPSNGRAPGYDDNASGIAVVSETLRAIVESGFKPERTIKLMGYAAEEVGLRGSGEISDQHFADGINVVGVAQFDMTGFKGTNNKDIVFMTDYTNAEQNQFMSNLLDHYFTDVEYGYSQCGYGCSDHASWFANGFPASMPFESNFNDYNASIHTANDYQFNPDHAVNFLNLSLAFVAELAKGDADPYESISTLEFSSSTASLNEAATVAVTIERSGLLNETATVNYQTIDGTGLAGEHYQATSGAVSWGVNESGEKSITVSALALSEDASFTLQLSDPGGNGELGEQSTMVINLVNESISQVSLNTDSLDVDESTTAEVRIQRTGDIDQIATVAYQTVNGSASAGTDYTSVSGTLEWAVGDSDDKVIELSVSNVSEDKTFTLDLRNVGGNAELGTIPEVTVTIKNTNTDNDSDQEEPPASNDSGGGALFLLSLGLLGLRRVRQSS